MKVLYAKKFYKDIERISHNRELLKKLDDKITGIKQCNTLIEISQLKKLEGYAVYYRIKVGDYRLGVKLAEETVTFLRFLHRKEIYRYFP